MGWLPLAVELIAFLFKSVNVFVQTGIVTRLGLVGGDFLEDEELAEALVVLEFGLFAPGFGQRGAHLDDLAQEGGVLLGEGLVDKLGQGDLAELVDLGG